MSEKEYIVSLKKGVDYQKFHTDMVTIYGDDCIPNRPVTVANLRPGSSRNTHYFLSEQEVQQLKNDPRVLDVELRPDLRNDIQIGRLTTQIGNFTKTTSDSGDFVNWGLRRINEATNPYTDTTVTGGYNYTLDGTGVDIVIQDSGIQADHPEFQDASGSNRVQQIDWYSASGLPGTMPTAHYTDFDGHGTHCAGIAAGKTYGWAKNARIYAVKVAGLEGDSDPNNGIPISDVFDVIKEWHNNKSVDPSTGAKRPTIVNMSWGYGTYFVNITGGSYRGTPWSGNTRDTAKGMVGVFDGLGYRYGTRVTSVDVDLEELLDAGVHVCIAAGNTSQKIDIEGGVDYDNYWTSSVFGTRYYHRGSSPFSERAFIVGNIDSAVDGVSTLEQKASSSETGPGVNIYAPGTNIMSCTSTTNKFADGDYPANSNFKICNISGTSMAAPQVAGALALYLQINPETTIANALSYMQLISKSTLYSPGDAATYTNSRSLLGGNNRFLFNEFNSAVQIKFGN